MHFQRSTLFPEPILFLLSLALPKRKSPKKRSGTKNASRFKRTYLRIALLLCLGCSIPLAIYAVVLDRIVVSKFEGKRFSIPAKVYARPLELYEGKELSLEQLQHELGLLNYRLVAAGTQPGEYSKTRDRVVIYTRPFTFWDGEQESNILSLHIRNNKISSLVQNDSGQAISLARLRSWPKYTSLIYVSNMSSLE